jgi:hypothetical protein
MSEANAEDGPLWSWTIKNVKMSEAQYRNRICILFSVRPEFPQNKKRSKWKIPPQTLLFHLRHPNSKTNQPKFWQILSPKNSFAKTSSALFRHLPEYLEGRTPKKNVLSTFKNNFTPAKSKKQETFFFGVAERSEAVAERYERTIQFQATTRSARAISRSQDYQQNTFELCLIHTANENCP